MNRDRRVANLIGLPYASLGRGPGYDCWGYAMLVNRTLFSIELPDYQSYSDADDRPDAALSVWEHTQDPRWVEVPTAFPGDLMTFRIGRFTCHIGVYIGEDEFLHCLRGRGSTLESIRSMDWRDRLTGQWRWSGA